MARVLPVVVWRFAAKIDSARSLEERLTLAEALVDDLRRNYRRRVGLDESWIGGVRRRARLGPRLRALLGRLRPTDRRLFD